MRTMSGPLLRDSDMRLRSQLNTDQDGLKFCSSDCGQFLIYSVNSFALLDKFIHRSNLIISAIELIQSDSRCQQIRELPV